MQHDHHTTRGRVSTRTAEAHSHCKCRNARISKSKYESHAAKETKEPLQHALFDTTRQVCVLVDKCSAVAHLTNLVIHRNASRAHTAWYCPDLRAAQAYVTNSYAKLLERIPKVSCDVSASDASRRFCVGNLRQPCCMVCMSPTL